MSIVQRLQPCSRRTPCRERSDSRAPSSRRERLEELRNKPRCARTLSRTDDGSRSLFIARAWSNPTSLGGSLGIASSRVLGSRHDHHVVEPVPRHARRARATSRRLRARPRDDRRRYQACRRRVRAHRLSSASTRAHVERARARVGRERVRSPPRLQRVPRGVRAGQAARERRPARVLRGTGCGRWTMDMVLDGPNGGALPEFKIAGSRRFEPTDCVLPSLRGATPAVIGSRCRARSARESRATTRSG